MKKMTKMLLAAGGAALICGGSIANYLLSRVENAHFSDLTLIQLESGAEPIILDQGQAIVIPKQRNNPRGEGCIGNSGTCILRNNGGW